MSINSSESKIMYDNGKFYIFIYIALWLITFLVYKRNRIGFGIGIGGFTIITYIIYAILAYVLYSTTNEFYGITLFPFIYLFVTILIALIPVLRLEVERIDYIKEPPSLIFNSISFVIIICTLSRISNLISNGFSGIILLLVDTSYGDDMYNKMALNYANGGDGTINIFPLFMNAFSPLCLLMFMYSLIMKRVNKVVYYGLFISTLIVIIDPIFYGSRTLPILNLLTLTALFLFFKNWIPKNSVKIIKKIGVISFSIIIILLGFLTISRVSNSSDNKELAESVSSYAGQAPLYFDLYGMDANGTRGGDRIVPVFKKIIGQTVPNNFVDRRTKYSHMLLNDANFSTFVGDFCLDFGPYITFFLIVLFTLYVNKRAKPRNNSLYFDQIILLYMVICTVVQGGMYLWSFADIGGNLKFIVLIIAYAIFRVYRLIYGKS